MRDKMSSIKLPSPRELRDEIKPSEKAIEKKIEYDVQINEILNGEDKRKLIIVGPCSIHDKDAAIEYATKLKELQEEESVKEKYLLVMRTYFEKPRSTIGWKGLINDPNLDCSFDLQKGLGLAREILVEILEIGVPCATEFLDPNNSLYIEDLISWGAIGARTVESQTHREMASGISCPIGFKNTTSGDIKIAVDACTSSKNSHIIIGINSDGIISRKVTHGNINPHLILRGGKGLKNFDSKSVDNASKMLEDSGFRSSIIVDCSHANSDKDYTKQPSVFETVMSENNKNVVGLMLESNLFEGNQSLPKEKEKLSELKYGVSITDACISFEKTRELLLK